MPDTSHRKQKPSIKQRYIDFANGLVQKTRDATQPLADEINRSIANGPVSQVDIGPNTRIAIVPGEEANKIANDVSAAQIERELKSVAGTEDDRGMYTEENANANANLVENTPKIETAKLAEDETKNAEQQAIDMENKAIEAAKLEGESRAIADNANSDTMMDQRDAIQAEQQATEANLEANADEARQRSQDIQQSTLEDVQNRFKDRLGDIESKVLSKDDVLYQRGQEELNKRYNEFVKRVAPNLFQSAGAMIQAIGNRDYGVSDRGLPTVFLNRDANNAVNQLAQNQIASKTEAAQGTLADQSKLITDTQATAREQLTGQNERLSDAQIQMAMPSINAAEQAGLINEQNRSEIESSLLDLQKEIAGTELENEQRYFIEATLPKLVLDQMNSISPAEAQNYAKIKELMKIGPWERTMAGLGIGAKALGSILRAALKDGGPINDNPNNDDVPDSVPAILAPGEFVISNPDVKKIRNGMGASVLKKIANSYKNKEKR